MSPHRAPAPQGAPWPNAPVTEPGVDAGDQPVGTESGIAETQHGLRAGESGIGHREKDEVWLIWAQDLHGAIGANGTMPWHLPEDLARFKEETWGHPVVMGRRTWEALPERFRPLPGRTNIVLTGDAGWQAEGAQRADSVAEAMALAQSQDLPGPTFVIGGAHVYAEFLPFASLALVTTLDTTVEADAYAPKLVAPWQCDRISPPRGWFTSTNGLRYRFEQWHRQASLW